MYYLETTGNTYFFLFLKIFYDFAAVPIHKAFQPINFSGNVIPRNTATYNSGWMLNLVVLARLLMITLPIGLDVFYFYSVFFHLMLSEHTAVVLSFSVNLLARTHCIVLLHMVAMLLHLKIHLFSQLTTTISPLF